ncbi:uncharacterized protein LOC112563158 [Pomacea canaliculata]|uniref:uncharacterized protein LOC112563158 n=1 Tax=Pomacea canaliculata TaxID=400727 RepID=UPI000D72DEF8|nr:uncharacterized protein LOC112563158 [Pomacea canaliculata]
MAFKVPKIPVCVAIAYCGVALVFQLVTVAGAGWLVIPGGCDGNKTRSVGLFPRYQNDLRFLVEYSEYSEWWTVCQVFSLLGLLAIVESLCIGILHCFLENTSVLSPHALAACAAAETFLIIELVVFDSMMRDINQNVFTTGSGFICSVIASVLIFDAAVQFIVGLRQ